MKKSLKKQIKYDRVETIKKETKKIIYILVWLMNCVSDAYFLYTK